MLSFVPVTVEEAQRLSRYFCSQPFRACDYTVGAVFQWRAYFQSEVAYAGGMAVLRAGIAAARGRFGAGRIRLEAQSHAVGFYERAGFAVCGEEFDEDGIPHVPMVLDTAEA